MAHLYKLSLIEASLAAHTANSQQHCKGSQVCLPGLQIFSLKSGFYHLETNDNKNNMPHIVSLTICSNNNISLTGLLKELNEIISVRRLVKCPIHDRYSTKNNSSGLLNVFHRPNAVSCFFSFLFSTVQHGDQVTHTCRHNFSPVVVLLCKCLDIVLNATLFLLFAVLSVPCYSWWLPFNPHTASTNCCPSPSLCLCGLKIVSLRHVNLNTPLQKPIELVMNWHFKLSQNLIMK